MCRAAPARPSRCIERGSDLPPSVQPETTTTGRSSSITTGQRGIMVSSSGWAAEGPHGVEVAAGLGLRALCPSGVGSGSEGEPASEHRASGELHDVPPRGERVETAYPALGRRILTPLQRPRPVAPASTHRTHRVPTSTREQLDGESHKVQAELQAVAPLWRRPPTTQRPTRCPPRRRSSPPPARPVRTWGQLPERATELAERHSFAPDLPTLDGLGARRFAEQVEGAPPSWRAALSPQPDDVGGRHARRSAARRRRSPAAPLPTSLWSLRGAQSGALETPRASVAPLRRPPCPAPPTSSSSSAPPAI